ncbi:MAG: hydroxymethylbilane synthase [Negativicoccus succinicivorans]|uniref:hydroxymethylbilane synthase n=1 Tax=Negativicoccus succinicivorans TaxID=620903 RepID=UPI002906D328|nr:hydroxymethylbilane synthase [Negativicoccus succinicivorans]MDU5395825.1 hydroxymethylbilane synthase [Negativicoccus succinicivorans]
MRNECQVGTRQSALALWQTRHVITLLEALPAAKGITFTTTKVNTEGDRKLQQALHTFGGKGAFTEALEAKLLDGSIDFAVHSLKDMPTKLPQGLVIGAIPQRAAVEDAFVSADGTLLCDLPAGARVGTSSLRRTAQLLHWRPDLVPVSIRGNVQTRLEKIETEHLAGVILARAGLERLGLADRITEVLRAPQWLPAAGQGALAIECRADDEELLALLAGIHDPETASAVAAERAILAALEGGCQVPIGAASVYENDTIQVQGRLLSLDGATVIEAVQTGKCSAAASLGQAVAEEILANGGRELWTKVRAMLEG